MPLPLIPILLGGASLAAGVFGVKKGLEARENFETAERITDSARNLQDNALQQLEKVRKQTQQSLENLGREKADAYETCLKPFIEIAQKIKNIEENDIDFDTDICFKEELAEIRQTSLEIGEMLKGGVTALSSGALAGFGALGAVGMLGTASTGTAIGALSGAAATNATLAWFGGGSLAAGGLGIAGGTMVLGGVVAAPVLAVGGLVLAAKAEEAVNDAYSNLSKAQAAAESLRAACTGARAIWSASEEIQKILQDLTPYCRELNEKLEDVVSRETDYRRIRTCPEDKHVVQMSFSLAKTLVNIIRAPLFDEEGAVTGEIRSLLDDCDDFLDELARM